MLQNKIHPILKETMETVLSSAVAEYSLRFTVDISGRVYKGLDGKKYIF